MGIAFTILISYILPENRKFTLKTSTNRKSPTLKLSLNLLIHFKNGLTYISNPKGEGKKASSRNPSKSALVVANGKVSGNFNWNLWVSTVCRDKIQLDASVNQEIVRAIAVKNGEATKEMLDSLDEAGISPFLAVLPSALSTIAVLAFY